MKKQLLILFIFSVLIQSCIVDKPQYSSVKTSHPENRIILVTNPYLSKKVSPIGIATSILMTSAGAFAGYQLNMATTHYAADGQPQRAPLLSATAGALLGFGISQYGNWAMGQGKRLEINDASRRQTWQKQFDGANKYIYMDGGEGQMRFIERKAAATYQIKTLEDAQIFVHSFPNQEPTAVLQNAYQNKVADETLHFLIKAYPKNAMAAQFKNLYLQRSTSFAAVLERQAQYPDTDSKLVEKRLAETASSASDALVFKKQYAKSSFENTVFDRIYVNADRPALKTLVAAFPRAKNNLDAQLLYYELSPDLSAFEESLQSYGILDFELPANYGNYATSDQDARSYLKALAGLEGTISDDLIVKLGNEVQYSFLNNKVATVSTKEAATAWKNEVRSMAWLSSAVRGEYENKAEKYIKRLERLELLAALKNEFGDAGVLGFYEQYAQTEEGKELLPEIEAITQKYVSVEESDISSAIGDRSWIGAIADSYDGIRSGGQYNFFGYGILKNDLDYPIKIDITATLNYKNTMNVSIISSTTNKTWAEKYYVEVPALGKTPFVVIYRNFSTGGTIGSGLFSAGDQSYLSEDPLSVAFKFYPNEIPKELKNKQEKLFKTFIKKGNITVNDSEEARAERQQDKKERIKFRRDMRIIKEELSPDN